MNAPAKAAPQRKSTAQKVSAKAARQHGKPAAAPQSPDVALPEPPAKKRPRGQRSGPQPPIAPTCRAKEVRTRR